MKTSNKSILEQVNDIQEKFDREFVKREEAKVRNNPQQYLAYTQAGNYEKVSLVFDSGVVINIWDSENDLGEWCEEKQEYESLESLIIRKLDIFKSDHLYRTIKELSND